MSLLHIDSSITGTSSASRQVTAQIADHVRQAQPGIEVVYRDLDAEPFPHLDSRMMTGAADDATRRELERNAAALEEFLGADVIVLGAPMYNFGISSQLKAWIDRIAVAGKTFTYTAQGPKGLAGGKTVIIASSRGGIYAVGTPGAALDFQEAYLQSVFRFLGVEDIRIVRAEGLAIGAEQREAAMTQALTAAASAASPALTSKAA